MHDEKKIKNIYRTKKEKRNNSQDIFEEIIIIEAIG